MKHKWHKEIKAWADGAKIEYKLPSGVWKLCDANENTPKWFENVDYRIKPQPKEPQYLYVYNQDGYALLSFAIPKEDVNYVGKIKIEVDDE